MGIDMNARIVVGLPKDDLDMDFDMESDEIDELLEIDFGFYGGSDHDRIVGIEVGDSGSYDYCELDMDILQKRIKFAKEHFKDEFNKEPKVYLVADVW